MNPNYTDITLILDGSGSMKRIADATVAGFNSFVREQQSLPGEVRLSLVQFNSRRRKVFEAAPIHDVPRMERKEYVLAGGTALLDAIGLTVDETGRRLEALAERDRPSTVIFAILTDGLENSSRAFTYQQVAERIHHQQEVYKWQFLFLGANQDAIAEATKFAIARAAALKFVASEKGFNDAFASLSKAVGDLRTKKKNRASFDESDREAQERENEGPNKPKPPGSTGTP